MPVPPCRPRRLAEIHWLAAAKRTLACGQYRFVMPVTSSTRGAGRSSGDRRFDTSRWRDDGQLVVGKPLVRKATEKTTGRKGVVKWRQNPTPGARAMTKQRVRRLQDGAKDVHHGDHGAEKPRGRRSFTPEFRRRSWSGAGRVTGQSGGSGTRVRRWCGSRV